MKTTAEYVTVGKWVIHLEDWTWALERSECNVQGAIFLCHARGMRIAPVLA